MKKEKRVSPAGVIFTEQRLQVSRAFADVDTWELCRRKKEFWVSHQGDVYNPDQLLPLIKGLKKFHSYLKSKKAVE